MGRAKYNAIRIAKELGYPAEIIERLRNAKTERQITNIMIDARRHMD